MIIETHPKDYTGLPFLSIIVFKGKPIVVIIDNINSNMLKVYMMDFCISVNAHDDIILKAAQDWFAVDSNRIPISIGFARRGIQRLTHSFYRSIPLSQIERIIGTIYEFPMNRTTKSKKRRRIPIPLHMRSSITITTESDNPVNSEIINQ